MRRHQSKWWTTPSALLPGDFPAPLGDTEPRPERFDRCGDLHERRGVERDHDRADRVGRPELAGGDGADRAQVLGDDDVPCQALDEHRVDRVQAAAVLDRLADLAIDLDALELGRVDPGRCGPTAFSPCTMRREAFVEEQARADSSRAAASRRHLPGGAVVSVGLTGFKAFSREVVLPLRPITLIYGENSSGKSSLIQGLLLLKQSAAELADDQPPSLAPKGPLVNLGSNRELIYRHDTARSLSIDVSFRPRASTVFALARKGGLPVRLRFEFGSDRRSPRPTLSRVSLLTAESVEPVITFSVAEVGTRVTRRLPSRGAVNRRFALQLERVNHAHPLWQRVAVETRGSQVVELQDRLMSLRAMRNRLAHHPAGTAESVQWGEVSDQLLKLDVEVANLDELLRSAVPLSTSGTEDALPWTADYDRVYLLLRSFIPGEIARDPGLQDVILGARGSGPMAVWRLVQALGGELERFLDTVSYLGPLRQLPDRIYVGSGDRRAEVGKAGEQTPHLLFRNPELVQRLNDQLTRFSLGYQFEVSAAGGRLGDLREVFAVRLKDERSRVNVGLSDVGFGVSQVLPILVQSLLARGQTLLVEQPEIHLHPRLQAELGSVIAEATKPPYSNRYVIETHSEHLLLRLQRLIREGTLTPADVGVIYAHKGRFGSKTIEIRLGDSGQLLDPWPGGFFEEGFREVFDHAR